MRKFYVLGAMLAITFSNAQATKKNLSRKSENAAHKPFVSHLKENTIKFEQTPDFESGIVSLVDQNDSQVFSADDFQLTETTTVDQFTFYGSQYYGDLPEYLMGAKMYIFSDNNGKPEGTPTDAGNAVAVINITGPNQGLGVITRDETEFILEIDITKALGNSLTLEADKRYWVAFAPTVELEDDLGANEGEIFYWAEGNGNFAEPVLIDKDNLYGAGAITWKSVSSLIGEPFGGLAFTITGETQLGTGEVYSNRKNVSVYPNPAVNVINLKANGKHAITKTEIFDMNGKLVITSKETSINVENLPKAVYVVKVYSGTDVIETSKIIKK